MRYLKLLSNNVVCTFRFDKVKKASAHSSMNKTVED